MTRLALGLAIGALTVSQALALEEVAVPQCFSTLPGTKDRSDKVITIPWRNWVSHDLSTYVTQIILKEFLRYDVRVVDATSRSTSAWGPNMVDGEFDVDMEQWQILSTSFREYVTRDQLVINFGPIGYPGRGGIFLTNANVALGVDKYADYYITYTDAAKALAVGLPKFGELDIRQQVGAEFPVCTASDWCGSGDFEGLWVPPQCQSAASSPSDCAEVIMMRPSWDSGYFEQLTYNLGLKLVHGYYGPAHNDLVRSRSAEGKPVLFYWYTPDPLVPGTGAARLSYPDFFVGCANGDTRRPDGPVACDYPEMNMLKLGHRRLRELPEAMYFLRRVELLTADIEGMMANHTTTGGPYNSSSAACAWVKSNLHKVQQFAPECIVSPPVNPVTGDWVFDKDKLECVQTVVYNPLPAPAQCLATADLGNKSRSHVTIKVGVRSWLTQALSTILGGLVLRDVLRYNVEFVDLSQSSTSQWGPEIAGGLWHLDAEQWQAPPDGAMYRRYVEDEGSVLDLGEVGYGGRGAIFTFKDTVDSVPASGYYKFFQSGADAFNLGFPRYGDVDARAFVTAQGDTFPICNSTAFSWCRDGAFEGYWVPPQCESNPTDCVEFFMWSPAYDSAYFEQLTRNLGLSVIHGYYGDGLSKLVKQRFNQSKPTLFYGWEPDTTPGQVGAVRLSYPDFSYGCDRSHNRNADTGGLECDYPETKMRKMGAAMLKSEAPEAYFFLSNLVILKGDIEAMMLDHTQGGGKTDRASDVACNFLKANFERLRAAFPNCIAYPKALDSIAIGDTVFDRDNYVCKEMTCPEDKTLEASGGRIFCQACPPGLVPNAAQSECTFCPKGTAVSGNRTACEACAPGRYAENRGQTECEECPKGTVINADGSTACELCEKGFWQDVPGSVACKACAASKTTDSRGMFTEESCQCAAGELLNAAGDCIPCPTGMTCPFGSKVANIALHAGDSSLPIPKVNPGYFTLASEPLSVYLCDDADASRCPGGLPERCTGGLVGLVCEECPEGEAWQDGLCRPCSSGPVVLVAVVLPLGLCLVALAMFKVANDRITVNVSIPLLISVLLGLFVTTLQALALFPGLSVTWREQGDFFAGFTIFLGRPDGIPLQCALTKSPSARFLFRCTLPLLCVLAVAFVWLLGSLTGKLRGRPGWSLDVALNTTGQLCQTLFIAIAVLVVQPLRCYGHPNGKQSMTVFPQIICWEDKEHSVLVIMGIAVGVCFVIPFLAACLYSVVAAPSITNAAQHYQRCRFLLYRFRADVWYWGIVFLFRQLALAFASCIPADSPQWQISYVAMVSATYLMVVCSKWPWKNATLNYVDVSSMAVILFIITSSAAFVPNRDEDVRSFVVFHFLICGSFFLYLLSVLGTALYWAKSRGLRGSYGSTARAKQVAEAWRSFVDVSSKMKEGTVLECIKTFTEFDVDHLVKAMGAFQSISRAFGSRMDPRLQAISHSSSDMQTVAKSAETDADNERRASQQAAKDGRLRDLAEFNVLTL